jgi:hypothetical protein
LSKKSILYMSLILALFTGRCRYSLDDGGYDLSRFRDDPGLTEVPEALRGLVATNGEAARAIAAADGSGPLRFVVIGDTVSDGNRTFKGFLREMAALEPPPAFVVHLGDRVVSPVVDFTGAYLRDVAGAPFPILHIDGNHDVREEGVRISRAFFGETDFYFDRNGMRFVLLDDVHGDERFGFTRKQLDWLDGVLKEPSPARKFVFAHVPPKAPFRKITPGPASLFTPRLENEQAFLDILARRGVVMAAFGHRHIHASLVHRGVLMVITGGGGQRNFLEPRIKAPLFTKKRHYSLIDIPGPGLGGPFEGILSCVGTGSELLFRSSFVQAATLTASGAAGVSLWPHAGPAGALSVAGRPAPLFSGGSSRRP